MRRTSAILLVLALAACEAPTRSVSMDYTAPAVYAAPFPGEHLRREDGTIDVTRFANPYRTAIVRQIHEALEAVDGFGTTSSIHFRLDGPIDPTLLPDLAGSTAEDASLVLIDVDPASAERGRRWPFDATFLEDGGPYGDANLLTLIPVQGMPLRPGTLYAAIVTDRLAGAAGEPMRRPAAMDDAIAGRVPVGMPPHAYESLRTAIDALPEIGVEPERVIAMTAFRTGDPTAVMERAVESAVAAHDLPLASPFVAREVFDTYCVFEGELDAPVFQEGEPPYLTDGGAWALDETGAPILQRTERARIVVTVPRVPVPAEGYPTAVLIRTGAGGDRPLVERGTHDADGATAGPGLGPALEFAAVGFAGVSVDGPHGGLRNPDMGDEQFRVFNIQNPTALRDNLRQSALELVLLADTLETLTLDASSCPGVTGGPVRFDTGHLALVGHSMGASIAPLAAAYEPRYRALVLSGAGGSWIENVMYKERPIATRGAAEAFLRYAAIGRDLTRDDVVLGLLQWAGESADAAVYARLLVEEPITGAPRHVLMFQGILDHYIPPPVANALSLSLAVDRAGPGLDETLPQFVPIEALLPLRGRAAIALPASGNRTVEGTEITAVVTQHLEDGIEDGHEVMWQLEAAKAQYRCFLRTFARGETPRVPDPAAPDPTCE